MDDPDEKEPHMHIISDGEPLDLSEFHEGDIVQFNTPLRAKKIVGTGFVPDSSKTQDENDLAELEAAANLDRKRELGD